MAFKGYKPKLGATGLEIALLQQINKRRGICNITNCFWVPLYDHIELISKLHG